MAHLHPILFERGAYFWCGCCLSVWCGCSLEPQLNDMILPVCATAVSVGRLSKTGRSKQNIGKRNKKKHRGRRGLKKEFCPVSGPRLGLNHCSAVGTQHPAQSYPRTTRLPRSYCEYMMGSASMIVLAVAAIVLSFTGEQKTSADAFAPTTAGRNHIMTPSDHFTCESARTGSIQQYRWKLRSICMFVDGMYELYSSTSACSLLCFV